MDDKKSTLTNLEEDVSPIKSEDEQNEESNILGWSTSDSEEEPTIEKVLAECLHKVIVSNPKAALAMLKGFDRKAVVSQSVRGITALSIAYSSGDHDLVTYLVNECGADVNQIAENSSDDDSSHDEDSSDDETEQTTLALTAVNDDVPGAKLLLSLGADVNLCVKSGYTPLVIAATHDNVDMIKCLLEAGADINKTDSNGRTALLHACRIGNDAAIRYLVEHGADINKCSQSGITALMTACQGSCDAELIRYLLDKGADMTKQDSDGDTVIVYALCRRIDEEFENIIADLLERDSAESMLQLKNNKGNSVMDEALQLGYTEEVIKMFLDKVSDPDVVNNRQSCRDHAALKSHLKFLFK